MRIKYKAIYLPDMTRHAERLGYKVVDAERLSDIPSGTIVIYRQNEDGAAEIYSEKKNKNEQELKAYNASLVYLEPKHDG